MMKRPTSLAIWLRIACAVLLLSLGFGHKPLHAEPVAEAFSSQYRLPDGTFADICVDGADHGKSQKSWLGSGCDLCRLTGNALLPTPPADYHPVRGRLLAVQFPPMSALFHGVAERPGSPVRGPPDFLT